MEICTGFADLASNWELLDNRGSWHDTRDSIWRWFAGVIVWLYSVQSFSAATLSCNWCHIKQNIEQILSEVWKLRKCFIILACWFSSVYFICIEKQKDIWDECYDGGGYDRTAARRNITCLPDNGLSVAQTFTRNLNLTLGMFSLSRPSASGK